MAAPRGPHAPVSAAGYIELFRLVNEIAWRIDHGRADSVWQLFAPTGRGLAVRLSSIRGFVQRLDVPLRGVQPPD
jgi:hypothetical protein